MTALTPRLMEVARQLPPGARLADVGTDHAYLPVWLVRQGKIPCAIATDVRPGPLERGRSTVEQAGLTHKIQLRLGDGLSPVSPEEVDAIAIAGMGGETVLKILAAAPWSAEKVCVVQPMSALEDFRRGLFPLGRQILRERLVCEGETLYIVFTLGAGCGEAPTPGECWVGKEAHHQADPLWPRYLERETRRAQRALEGLRCSQRERDRPRRQYLEAVCEELAALSLTWKEGREGS